MAEKKDIAELKKNAEFMRVKLEEVRKSMAKEPIVVEYDNGGGQTGVRENPIFGAYEKLLKSYQQVLRQIEDIPVDDVTPKKAGTLTVVGGSQWKSA